MLSIHSICKSFGENTILKDISFNLNPGERLGLIGSNGCGKTTLLRILVGLDKADSGSFTLIPPDLRVGYLPQGLTLPSDQTLEGYLISLQLEDPALAERLQELASAISQGFNDPGLQYEYDRTLSLLQDAQDYSNSIPTVLAALGLDQLAPSTPVHQLSGGQKTRLALAGVLLSAPQVLLLDEPTNHLDIDMLEWLEDWINSPHLARTAVLLVSHDRVFLDRTVTGLIELDSHTHLLHKYSGNYTNYLEQKSAEHNREWQKYTDQQEEISRLRQAVTQLRGLAQFRRGGKGDSGDKFAKGFFANRTKFTVARAKHLEGRIEQLLTEDRVEKPHQEWQLKCSFGETPPVSRTVLRLENIAVGYGNNILLSQIHLVVRYDERVAIIGGNGSGKTTLLRTITGEIQPLTGEIKIGPGVKLGYMAQEQETLDPSRNVLDTVFHLAPFSETNARAFLHKFLFSGEDVFTPVGKLSYGERSRLLLACLVASGCNTLLLDEPVNYLDIPSRARFEHALSGFNGAVIVVAHDRFFINNFANTIWKVHDRSIQRIIA